MRSRDAGSRAAGDRRDAEGVPTEPSSNSSRTIVKRPRGSWAAQDLKRVPHTLRYTVSPINGRASFARPVDHWKRTACTHLNPGERGGVAGYHSFTLCIDVSKRHAFPSTPPSTLGQKNPPPPCAVSEPQAARGRHKTALLGCENCGAPSLSPNERELIDVGFRGGRGAALNGKPPPGCGSPPAEAVRGRG